ncbi:carbonic anhydrase [Edaphovirga cremea]|uniref:carbonic anhydrase n=1 Tax=Edaphovirga cremea TaxID=2267246 RepID=UPI000DEF7376|nr:carbonic anhydrase family protein [Edaphovirga cremea]
MKHNVSKAALLVFSMLPAFAFAAHWSYVGKESPEHWSELNPDYKLCQQGQNQSPIDIHAVLQAHISPLEVNYQDAPNSILNNGHTIQVSFPSEANDNITVDGEKFTLQQFHFHAPSENTVNGKHYAMELHLVHKNTQGEIAVVAVMFEEGKANPELDKLWQAMPATADQSQPLTQKIDINQLLPKDLAHYRFSGSLTTPPCSEGVRWLVLKHSITLSAEQLKKFTDVMHHDNNRPTQPLHGRVVVE